MTDEPQRETSECVESIAEVLLYGDESGAEFLAAEAHLRSCQSCRDRLLLCAPDSDFQSDVVRSMIDDGVAGGRRGPQGGVRGTRAFGNRVESPGPLSPAQRLADSPGEPQEGVDCLGPPAGPGFMGSLGRYDVEKTIGSGGMGLVLKGFDRKLNRPIAIKVLGEAYARQDNSRERFAREARATAAVIDENVIAIHDVNTEGSTPYFVMAYVSGESLQERVDRDGPLEPEEICRIGAQIASGLQAAHEQGVVHRDIKPSNILLEARMERAVITDFGLARVVADADLTSPGMIAGTPNYMSPEQSEGGRADTVSDLFSLGAVLHFLATGGPPFPADSLIAVLLRIRYSEHQPIREFNPRFPESLERTVGRLLQKSPGRRYQTAANAKAALLQSLEDLRTDSISGAPAVTRFGSGVVVTLGGVVLLAAAIAIRQVATPAPAEPHPSPVVQDPLDGPPSRHRGSAAGTAQAAPVSPAEILEWESAYVDELAAITNSITTLRPPSLRATESSADWRQALQDIRSDLNELQQLLENSPFDSKPLDGEMK